MKKLGAPCIPRNWLLKRISDKIFNFLNVEPEYFILNDTTAGDYWKISENFDGTLGSQLNQHYAVIGTDGEHCIKSIFSKIAVERAVSKFVVENSQSASTSNESAIVDWRHCSLYLTKFYLKLMLPTNSNKPEIVLIVEDFVILHLSDVDALDYVSGFMNYCMNFKNVQTIVTEEYCRESFKTAISRNSFVNKNDVDSENNHNLSVLISELTKKVEPESQKASIKQKNGNLCDGFDIQNVNISVESDDYPPPKKGKASLMEPLPTVALWKNAPNDVPGWKIGSSPLVTSSPIVTSVSPSVSTASSSNEACVNGDPIEIVKNLTSITERFENHASRSNADEELTCVEFRVRSARIQTSNKVTGWTNDMKTCVNIESCPMIVNYQSVYVKSSCSDRPSSANRNLLKDSLPLQEANDSPLLLDGQLEENSSSDDKIRVDLEKEQVSDDDDVEFLGHEGSFQKSMRSKKRLNDYSLRSKHSYDDDDKSPNETLKHNVRGKNVESASKSFSPTLRRSSRFINSNISSSSHQSFPTADDDFYHKFCLSNDLKEKCFNFIFD